MDAQNLRQVRDDLVEDGMESLAPTDRELFCIQDSVIEYEMGGLLGYFHNRLPDLAAR